MRSVRRIVTLARRVIRQIVRDRRTVALLILAPMLVLFLGAILFRSEPAAIPLGIVNDDKGLTSPLTGKLVIGQRIADELAGSEIFTLQKLRSGEIDSALRNGTVDGVLVLPEGFSAGFLQNRQAVLDLRLEGSNPTRSVMITARITEAAMKALAGLASLGFGLPGAASTGGGEAKLPVTVGVTYLFAGPEFDTMLIIPQVLLGGTFWAVEEMPGYLRPFAYLMPITYANRALRDVMLKGWGLAEIWPNLLILLGIAALLIVLGALTTRREVA